MRCPVRCKRNDAPGATNKPRRRGSAGTNGSSDAPAPAGRCVSGVEGSELHVETAISKASEELRVALAKQLGARWTVPDVNRSARGAHHNFYSKFIDRVVNDLRRQLEDQTKQVLVAVLEEKINRDCAGVVTKFVNVDLSFAQLSASLWARCRSGFHACVCDHWTAHVKMCMLEKVMDAEKSGTGVVRIETGGLPVSVGECGAQALARELAKHGYRLSFFLVTPARAGPQVTNEQEHWGYRTEYVDVKW